VDYGCAEPPGDWPAFLASIATAMLPVRLLWSGRGARPIPRRIVEPVRMTPDERAASAMELRQAIDQATNSMRVSSGLSSNGRSGCNEERSKLSYASLSALNI
jgi:hypothetical protein